ncbi:unnamed protein product [Discosporangium mesarthrocarpum]
MSDWAHTAFKRESIVLVLYDKFSALHDTTRPRSYGNYLPAPTHAENLPEHTHGGGALCLLFLSDRKPCDHQKNIHCS